MSIYAKPAYFQNAMYAFVVENPLSIRKLSKVSTRFSWDLLEIFCLWFMKQWALKRKRLEQSVDRGQNKGSPKYQWEKNEDFLEL